MTAATPRGGMKTYYDLLAVKPRATSGEIEIAFRRYAARFRVTSPTRGIFTDPRFREYVNAYLTLRGPMRSRYDELLRQVRGTADAEPPTAGNLIDELSVLDRRLLMARVAMWRRESIEAADLLREYLDRHPDAHVAYVQLGEVYFTTNRLEEGIRAYERACRLDAGNARYTRRLEEARKALAGKGDLRIEESFDDELLHEQRRKRALLVALTVILGVLVQVYTLRFQSIDPFPGALYIPWNTVGWQMIGIAILLWGLAYGRIMPSFEEAMVTNSIQSGDRGTLKRYPYGLLLFVTAIPSLWTALIALGVMATLDEEWPYAPTIMLGVCALTNLALAFMMWHSPVPDLHDHWVATLIMGGNLLVPAAMLGWWSGSLMGSR